MQLSSLDATDVSAPKQQDRKRIRIPRVAIVGTGFVGSTTAYALLISGTAAEIVLIDRDRRRAEGHVQDLRDAELFSHNTRIFTGDLADCSSADVTIITTGVSQSDSKSRLDGLRETAAILKGLVQGVSSHNPHGILLIASNPVDVLTYAAWKWSGLPASRVLGSGTTLDTSRFRRRLAERYGVASDNVHAYIIGEHGDTQVPVISSARIAGVPLEGFCRELGLCDEERALKTIANDTRAAGLQIIKAKDATYYGIGGRAGSYCPRHFARRASGVNRVQLGAPIDGAGRSVLLPSRHHQPGRGRSCAFHPTQPAGARSPQGLSRGPETVHRSFGHLTIDDGPNCFLDERNASKCQSAARRKRMQR